MIKIIVTHAPDALAAYIISEAPAGSVIISLNEELFNLCEKLNKDFTGKLCVVNNDSASIAKAIQTYADAPLIILDSLYKESLQNVWHCMLQVDCDVLVSTNDDTKDFLEDMYHIPRICVSALQIKEG